MSKSKPKSPRSQLTQTDIAMINEQFGRIDDPSFSKYVRILPLGKVDEDAVARCKKAAKEYLPEIARKFPDSRYRDVAKVVFLDALSLPNRELASWRIDGMDEFVAAQAIWLLDSIAEKYDVLDDDKLMPLLPPNPPEMGDSIGIFFCDTVHDQYKIEAMIGLIKERNGKYKESFKKLVKLINKNEIKRVCSLFEEQEMDFLSRGLVIELESLDALRVDIAAMLDEKGCSIEDIDPSELPEVAATASIFLHRGSSLSGRTYDEILGILDDKHAADLMYDFGGGDPYDLCAGYLFLSENDSPAAHMNSLTAAVLRYALSCLPWGNEDYYLNSHVIADDSRFKDEVYELTMPDEEAYDDEDDEDDEAESESAGDSEDEPEISYEYRENVRLSQILYTAVSIILPRRFGISPALVDELKEQGLPESTANEVAKITALFFRSTGRDYRDYIYAVKYDTSSDEASPADSGDDRRTPEEKLAAAEEQLSRLKTNDSRLRMLLQKLEDENDELKKRFSEFKRLSKYARKELEALRNTISALKSDEYSGDAPPDESISFPYTTKRRVYIFGGDDDWCRELKTLLPSAVFHGIVPRFTTDSISSADIVWIQTKSVSSYLIDLIADTVQVCKKPIRYFVYDSARACAEEIVRYDMGDDADDVDDVEEADDIYDIEDSDDTDDKIE
ncbi:MAG: hypothetical protein GX628_00885 [Clostridiales bacterium]|nr:hypothetical protein [Clostridiales bacterium]